MDTVVSFLNSLDGGGAPEWVQLLPSGTFRGRDGRGPWRVADATALIARSLAESGGRLPVDENHSTDLAAPRGGESPARGWIVELQERDGAIWGRVEWTEAGRALVGDRAYRGISPVFAASRGGEVVQLLRAALTNTPNLDLTHLNSKGLSMDLAALRQALGLADDVTAEAAVAAAAALRAERDAARTELNAARASAVDPAVVTQLQAQLDGVMAERARDRAVAFVDGAIAAGRPVRALRDHYIARHMRDAAAVETEINAMVSVNAGTAQFENARRGGSGEPDGDEPTMMERNVAQAMGLDPKKIAEQRRKRMNGGA